ncbi:MAG: GAF domain-containing protein, partial [Anaerolineae bacterium]|nr:GAF domain-containing protein [Anaerolineae bacterium]
LTLTLSVPLVIGWQTGFFADQTTGAVTSILLLVLLAVSVMCLVLAKQGRVMGAIAFYVWCNLVVIIAASIVFSSSSSAIWFFLLWPVTLSGFLMQPADTVRFTAISIITYSVIVWIQGTGRYVPPYLIFIETTPFLAFFWILAVIVGGLVSHMVNSSFRSALTASQKAEQAAKSVSAELDAMVLARTQILEKRANQFQVIAELGKVTAKVREQQILLDTVVKLISEKFDFYHVAVFLLDPTGEWAVLRSASSAGGARILSRGHRLRVGEQGVVGYVSRTGLPRFALDVGEDAVWFSNPDLPETKSEVALPLLSKHGTFGVLDIQTRIAAAFDEHDVEVLHVLADNVAIAIENVNLIADTQEALTRLEQYREQDAIRAWRNALARKNIQASYVYRSGFIEPLSDQNLGEDSLTTVEKVTYEVTDAHMHRISAPVTVGGQLVGSLVFERLQPWSDETVHMVASVINQLDLALNNARLLDETRLRASHEAARSEIVARVRALTSTDAIMRHAAEELGRALGVERSRIQLVQYEDKTQAYGEK